MQCRQHLASLLPPTSSVSSSVSSTQHSFQKALDDALRSSIKVSLVSLREQACFSAVAYPHAGTWLKAISNSSLGLAMSPREFVTSLHLCLGIPVFPAPHTQSVVCVCAVINWIILVTVLLAVVLFGLSDMMPYVTSSSTGCSYTTPMYVENNAVPLIL